jgi:RHS repeat-associated protein
MNRRFATFRRSIFGGAAVSLMLLTSASVLSQGGPAASPRPAAGETATLLPDGNWLLLGGWSRDGSVSPPRIVDQHGRLLARIGTGLQRPRAGHSATVMPDGSIVVIGGVGRLGEPVDVIERLDVGRGRFEVVATVPALRRTGHTATLLPDGRVLVVGGSDLAHAGGTHVLRWDSREPSVAEVLGGSGLTVPRSRHQAHLDLDGRVRVTGGVDATGRAVDRDDVVDAETGAATIAPAAAAADSYLVESNPVNGAQDVAPDARLNLRFSTPLGVRSVSERTVTLQDEGGQPVPTQIVAAETGRLVFIRPVAPLDRARTYRLAVAGVRAVAGGQLPPATVTFTVAGAPADQPVTADDESWVPDIRQRGGWRSNRESSPWQRLPPLKAAPGVTALAGQILRLNGQPLPGVTLKVGRSVATSDRTGRFLVESTAPGRQELLIDARRAGRGGRTYGVFRVAVDVKAGETTVLTYTSWLPQIDTRHAVTIPSPTTRETILTTPSIPGLEVRLPAGTVIRDVDQKIVREVSITPIPIDRTPFPLPHGVHVPIYFTIQPGGAYLESVSSSWPAGARVIYPNYHSLRGGTEVDFWHYDPEGRGWFVYGLGTVTPDARRIEPKPGVVIYEFTGAMVGDPDFAPPDAPPPCSECADGDPVDLATGLFIHTKTDLALPGDLPIELTRTYRPGDTRSRAFGIGTSHQYEMFLVGDTHPYTYAEVVVANGSRIRFERVSPGTGFNDAVYEHTSSPSPFYKAKIYFDFSGWMLELRDGTRYRFPESEFVQTPAEAAITGGGDRFNNTLSLTRSSAGLLTRITSSSGKWIDLTYDVQRRITEACDHTGRTVGYEYDATGRLWRVTDPAGGVTEYAYDSAHRMTAIKDPRGVVFLVNQFDLDGRVTKQTMADGATYQFAYTIGGTGRITSTDVTDPRGIVRRVTFNDSGYWLTDTRAVGRAEQQTTTVERQAGSSLVTSRTDALGRRTTFGYDATGNITSVTRLAGTDHAVTSTATFTTAFNDVETITDPLNHTTTFAYDGRGALERVTDHLGHAVTLASNTAGQTTSLANGAGSLQFLYEAGDLAGVINGAGRTTRLALDGLGRETLRVDPLGHTTGIDYDILNRPTRIVDAQRNATTLTYDANGNTLSVTDARGGVTAYTYDSMDRPLTRADPLLQTERYVYDRGGNLFQHIDRRGQATTYRYDALNRLTRSEFGDGSTIEYTYDAGSRVVQVVDSLSGTITLGHDDLDRLTSETTSRGTVTYTYDAAGRRIGMSVPGQSPIAYAYDEVNRLISIAQGSSTATFEYDAANRRTALVMPNGVRVEYAYTAASQLAGVTYRLGSTVLGTISYTYDAAGRRTGMGGTWARTLLPPAVSSASYDAANRLISWNGGALTYDANGNLVSEGTRSYGWDARSQLSAIGGMVPATFQYDGFGRRVSKTVAGATTDYHYAGSEAVAELTATGTTNLLYGPGIDELLTRTDGTGSRTLVADGIGSVLALLDPSGATQTEYTYSAFGAMSGTGAASTNSTQYTGRENDGTGLYYYRARYYSPRVQRFVSEDPIGFAAGSPNLYGYVGNAPTMWSDPFGLDRMDAMLDALQALLDLGGLIPGAGEPLDLVNAGVSAARGDRVGAGLSVAAMLPVGGQAAGAANVARRAAKAANKMSQHAKRRAAKALGGIPQSCQPIRQHHSKDGKWWEYRDQNGREVIVVEHPDGSVHVGTPKPQSPHRNGGPPKYYQVPGSGHVGGQ